ncbi:phospholipase D zeta 1-like [Impatiens glandulifera]|uniref:phospholipase D zeta 1-like n=1 Tax=Impatiens glandulifera TaxID=253017 RepID=UPI001FB189CB|nr:phospholipase D zeta 1-like [Impatiens glandulifera]
MSSEKLLCNYVPIRPETLPPAIFQELPEATIVSVSRPDAGDFFTPVQLTYIIQLQYKQFKWILVKKASQVIYLHIALRKRAIIEELHEKQEQVKEWLHNIGIGDHQTTVVHDNDEPDDGAIPIHPEEISKNRYVPSKAALQIIRPALGAQDVSENAKVAMQGYLNHFLGNINIVNSREVCSFLEVSKFSFAQEFGAKLKEGYLMVNHLPKIPKDDGCLVCPWLNCFNNWQKVWAVLKPGFLALLDDPFDANLLDIIIFDVPSATSKDEEALVPLAEKIKERNPLYYAFQVLCGNGSINLRTTSRAKVEDWVLAINDVSMKPLEGWSHPHRFGSFAPPRGLIEDASQAQWFVDGQAAFEAIACAIENAKSEIFITGWWLCPELYLRRPYLIHGSSRLDVLLEAKAKQGIQIYILMYKEVSIALKINSSYSMKRLLNIHENVKVLRYPHRRPAGIYLWSHHEKLVIVDYRICFIGGLDLCFGRFDTIEHNVGDSPSSLWPGKDYYNPRESEPNSWEDTMKDELEREQYPRMPWHDVHCAISGPPCRDVARHFVQRWNHAKRNKAPKEEAIPLLIPQHHMVLPHYLGNSMQRNIEIPTADTVQENFFARQDSFSSQSPLEDLPLLLPMEVDGLDQINTNNKLNDIIDESQDSYQPNNEVDPSYPDKKIINSVDELNFMDVEDDTSTDDMTQQDSYDWWEKQESDYQDFSHSEISQVGPRCPCRCQVIRSVSQWSAGSSQTEDSIHRAYCSLIEQAQHCIYIENQFFISGIAGDDTIQNRVLDALYNRILRAQREQTCFRVIIVMPLLPGFQGGLDDGGAATVRAIMHWQYRTICRGKNSILQKLNALLGLETNNYISFYGLRTYGRLSPSGPVVTSQVYVHSKVMIIDDRVAFIGSSNINDRSLLGSRDSEIGIVVEDKEFVESSMNGKPWKAGKFAHSLRVTLWAEHLGLQRQQVDQIRDPIADSTYKELWLETAKINTMIYQDVFGCVPNDTIQSRHAFRQSMNHAKEKVGHTTIDLGVAPEKLEIFEEGKEKSIMMDPIEKLKDVKGFLVLFPLEFMKEENLKPVFVESEFYVSPQVYH